VRQQGSCFQTMSRCFYDNLSYYVHVMFISSHYFSH